VPIFSVSPDKIVAQLPYDMPDLARILTVQTPEGSVSRIIAPVLGPIWGILNVLRPDGTLSSPENRIPPGETVTAYVTGFISDMKVKPPSGAPAPESPEYAVAPPPPYTLATQPGDHPNDRYNECQFVSARVAPGFIGVAEVKILIPANINSDTGLWDMYMVNPDGSSNKFRLYPVIR
jgi:uncharacterized protein (TIGR03437 family)